ncbi:copper resistance protein CopC [Nonomuraea sp. 3-1Str]|uniref:copper resistance CopC family protein n=1 Tax=Nonomuraea sp. 3-1Str TaxID=2929801 RepID=UPI0028640094|nr:copper resistance protein CopC [Nonomuraea sp. 3-1Str]MDR8407426.1 copper resistance protein CopC [Nonomuraea sp. 3-1Str]
MALSPRFLRSLLAVMLACGAWMVFTASPSLAHDSLKSSSPAKNAKVASVKEIELEYSAQVRFPAVVLHDSAGKQVTVGTPRTAGHKVFAEVPQPLEPGSYVIGWRVVSSDGHPIEGEILFTVTAKRTSTPEPTPTAVPSTTTASPFPSDSTASPGPVKSPVSGSTARSGTAQGSGGAPAWLWGAGAALLAVGAGVWLWSRRRDGSGPAE